MKYSTSITAFSFGWADSQAKRKIFAGLMALLLVALGFGYWQYLHNLSHVSAPTLRRMAEAKAAAQALPNLAPPAPAMQVLNNPVAPTPVLPVPVAKPAIPQAPAMPVAAAPLVAAPAVPVPAAKVVPAKPVAVPVPARRTPVSPALRTFTEADRLAQAGKQAFGNLIDTAYKYPDACGFKPDDNLLDARLGAAILVYQITAPDRAGYQAGQPVQPLLKPADRWVFPVLIGDQIRSMVQVTREGHKYVPGDSSRSLGLAWGKILARWSDAQGFHPRLVINPDIPGYFFTVPELAQQNLTDTDKMIFFHDEPSPAAVILASWR
jgi:hypothetical protein